VFKGLSPLLPWPEEIGLELFFENNFNARKKETAFAVESEKKQLREGRCKILFPRGKVQTPWKKKKGHSSSSISASLKMIKARKAQSM